MTKSKFVNKIRRIVVSAIKDISRNIWLNMTTVIIITIALFIITIMFAIDVVGSHTLKILQEKIDISIQFNENAEENKILELKKDIEELQEVKSTEYISKDQALESFKETHKDKEYIRQSIEELGDNPLFAVLNVKANKLDQYGTIDEYINGNENYKDIIENVNFKKNEVAINNFSNILKTVKDSIVVLTILFILIGVSVAFSTIRLAMYAHKKEIEIMRLIGASNWYIRMPFIIEGVIFGVLSSVITIILIFPAIIYVSPKVTHFFPDFDLYEQFIANFINLSLLLLSIGIGLGVVGSAIAIRRYLKI